MWIASMAWVYVFIAGLCEIGWAVGLKYTDGFTKLYPSIGTAAAMIVSFVFLSFALRSLPIGTAYAVWTGIGVVGTAVFGMVFLGEPRDVARMVCMGLILSGIVGLKLLSPSK